MHLKNIAMLHLLWALPVLVAVYVYAHHRRRSAIEAFAAADVLLAAPSRRALKAALALAAIAFVVLAVARPQWNLKPTQMKRRGRDVVFILDVSRSMLAEDLRPSRLERAKLAIRDCVERIEGDRVGLVLFAGTSAVKCPLTLDYGFFNLILDDVSTDSIARGGTKIGDALRRTMDDVLDGEANRFMDIVLITDGEDHESFPVEAARKAGEAGIRIIAIGLGDEGEGKRIPVTDKNGRRTYLKHGGGFVWSKLDGAKLREMAAATPGGRYLNVATGTIDLGDVYTRLIADAQKKELESKAVKRYEEKYQIFLGVAFALLCADAATRERKGGKSR